MSLFEKLMLVKQLSFKDGSIDLMGWPLVFAPANFFSLFIGEINDDPKLVAELYYAAKQSNKEGFTTSIGKSYGMTFIDTTKFFVDLVGLVGWGNATWVDLDSKSKKGKIAVQGSVMTTNLKGKVKTACDHVIRGFMAGGASSAFKTDVDMLELECMALGAQRCIFVMDTKENLKAKYPELAKQQLGD